jgi:hypothetical protein
VYSLQVLVRCSKNALDVPRSLLFLGNDGIVPLLGKYYGHTFLGPISMFRALPRNGLKYNLWPSVTLVR